MASFRATFLFLQAILSLAYGQDTSSTGLEAYPNCALECIVTAFGGGSCAPTNQTCICTNEQLQNNITACVTESCPIIEALSTKNISATRCGLPVRNRSGKHVSTSVSMFIFAAVFVGLRFGYKVFAKIEFGMNDWLVLASIVATTPAIFVNVFGTASSGLGKDIWTLPPDKITDTIKYFWVATILYFLDTALTKLSIISFYIHIFPSARVRRLLWGTFAVTSAWGFAFVVGSIVQCQPISYFWTHWDGLHKGHCASPDGIGWSHAIMNIIFDLWILAIPLSQLRKMKLHWKKKVGIAIMFFLGTFVTVVSIVRLPSLAYFTSTTNVTMNFYDLSLWSTVEVCLGIVCACLPTIRLLLVRVFPILGRTNRQRSSYVFMANKTGLHYRDHPGAGKSADEVPISYPAPSFTPITFYREDSVNDDTRLVRLENLDAESRMR